jgi:hypothetical protein
MFYPGSGSLQFSSRILLYRYIKRGMKNKSNLFLLLMVLGESLIIEKIKEQGFLRYCNLRKSHQKHTVPSGSAIRDLGSGSATLVTQILKCGR